MKYMLTLAIGSCIPLHSNALVGLCNSPVFLPLLEALLELTVWKHVGQWAIICDVQEHFGKNAFAADFILRNKMESQWTKSG
jgi:hypothetical protein